MTLQPTCEPCPQLSHTIRHTVGLFWASNQPVAEASTYTGQHKRKTSHSGIGTRHPSNEAGEDLRLILQGVSCLNVHQ
jgi:hypothetical protein